MRAKTWKLLFLLLPTLAAAEQFSISADSSTSDTSPGREKTLLKGNAKVVSDSMTITAELVEMSGKNFRYALAKGGVMALDKNKGLIIRAQELFYDREKKISRVNGAAVLEDQKNEIIVKGGFFENLDKEDTVIIQIGVRILKKDLTCRSEYAKYNRKTEMLELSGLPVVFYKGDEFRADKIKINIKTNEISLDGRVSGTVIPDKNKDKDPAKTPDSGVTLPVEPDKTDKVPGALELGPQAPPKDPKAAEVPQVPVTPDPKKTPEPTKPQGTAPDGK